MSQCTHCGFANTEGSEYCAQCGTALVQGGLPPFDAGTGQTPMGQGSPPPYPGSPQSPPVQPLEYGAPPSSSSWPTVIGIIAIIFGVGGTLGGIWGAVSPVFMKAMAGAMRSAAPQGQNQVMPEGVIEMMEKQGTWIMASSLLNLFVAVILLIAGIGLLKRSRWGVGLVRKWAIARIIIVVLLAAANFVIQKQVMSDLGQMSNMPAGTPQAMQNMGAIAGVMGACIGLAWGWALPIFVLIWFSRKTIKEEVAQWD